MSYVLILYLTLYLVLFLDATWFPVMTEYKLSFIHMLSKVPLQNYILNLLLSKHFLQEECLC